MTQTNPSQNSENKPDSSGNQQPIYSDWREQRRAERAAWRDQRHQMRADMRNGPGGWVVGAVLIALGVLFLLQNAGFFTMVNWWALFILIPAFISFSNAFNSYQANGRLTAAGRGSLTGAIFLTLLSAVFLFGFNLGVYWPLLLILGGILLLVNAVLPQ